MRDTEIGNNMLIPTRGIPVKMLPWLKSSENACWFGIQEESQNPGDVVMGNEFRNNLALSNKI